MGPSTHLEGLQILGRARASHVDCVKQALVLMCLL